MNVYKSPSRVLCAYGTGSHHRISQSENSLRQLQNTQFWGQKRSQLLLQIQMSLEIKIGDEYVTEGRFTEADGTGAGTAMIWVCSPEVHTNHSCSAVWQFGRWDPLGGVRMRSPCLPPASLGSVEAQLPAWLKSRLALVRVFPRAPLALPFFSTISWSHTWPSRDAVVGS